MPRPILHNDKATASDRATLMRIYNRVHTDRKLPQGRARLILFHLKQTMDLLSPE